MKIITYTLYLCLWLGNFLTNTQAQSQENEDNLREACRKRIAGLVLNLADDRLNAQRQVLFVTQTIERLKRELLKQNVIFSQLQENKQAFDYEQSLKRDDVEQYVKFLDTSLKDNETSLLQEKSRLSAAEEEFSKFEQKMDSIFKIVSNHELQNGYQFEVQYKIPCPKFHVACPLSTLQAKNLREMLIPLPEACMRYSNIIH